MARSLLLSSTDRPASYIAVAILLCFAFWPAGKYLSVIAAIFSLMGSANEIFWRSNFLPIHLHSLVYFGCYCTLLGLLILRSKFMPHLLGYLLLLAGAGWLTFLSPHLAAQCSPFNYIAGGLGEIPLMLWLLIKGLDPLQWHLQNGTQNSAL